MGTNNSQVAHLWAHQSKERAEGSHLSFHGPTLQSYGTAIAWLDTKKQVAFVSSRNMSPTTGKHISHVRDALYNYISLVVLTPAFKYGESRAQQPAFMLKEAAKLLTEEFKVIHRKRKCLQSAIDYYERKRSILLEAARLYKVKLDLPEASGDLKAKAAIIMERERKARKAQEAKDRARQKAALIAAQVDLERWLNGEGVSFPYAFRTYQVRLERGEMLTIRGDTVHTSLGAEVPVSHAKRALRAYRTKARPWQRNGENIHVGHFQIDAIAENGDVKAGCHLFKAAEIERFSKKWGLEEVRQENSDSSCA